MLFSRGAPTPETAAARVREELEAAAREAAQYPEIDPEEAFVGALRRAMATTGYSDVKEFQRVEVVLAPTSHG